MPKRSNARNVRPLPHASYGVDLSKLPDTYIEPFVAYRAWNWTAEGITSLNGSLWTPKLAFEATCAYRDDWKSMLASANSEETRRFWKSKEHHVPSSDCSCGMYAGINMQHMIDINYIQRGIHGEVSLWGRLHRHTLGWRAQYAYPKFFVVPANMVPFRFDEAQADFIQAERKFREINSHPDVVTDIGLNVRWWIAMEKLYVCEKRLVELFCGSDRSLRSIAQYNAYRERLIRGKRLYRTDA